MRKVELYVRSEKQLSPTTHQESGTCEHTATGQVEVFRPHGKLKFEQTKTLRESDKRALEIVGAIAKEKGWRVEVVDLSSYMGKMKASLKGVRSTPVMFIGGQKIEGVPTREQLLSL